MRQVLAALAVMFAAAAAPSGASAGSASVALTGVVIELTPLSEGGGTWSYVPDHVDWAAAPSATGALVQDPPSSQWTSGWFGENQSASATAEGASASATLQYGSTWIGDAASLTASAAAGAGQSASAYAQLYQGNILVSALTHVRLVATLDTLTAQADGGSANAVASLMLWDDAGFFAQASAEWRESADFSLHYDGPNQLVLEWDNTSTVDGRWLGVAIAGGADVLGAVSSVPEPGAFALMALGLAVVGWQRRRT